MKNFSFHSKEFLAKNHGENAYPKLYIQVSLDITFNVRDEIDEGMGFVCRNIFSDVIEKLEKGL